MFEKQWSNKKLVSLAMLIALQVVLTRLFSINAWNIRIGLGFIPILWDCGICFGSRFSRYYWQLGFFHLSLFSRLHSFHSLVRFYFFHCIKAKSGKPLYSAFRFSFTGNLQFGAEQSLDFSKFRFSPSSYYDDQINTGAHQRKHAVLHY